MCTCVHRWLPARTLLCWGRVAVASGSPCRLYITNNGLYNVLLASKKTPQDKRLLRKQYLLQWQEYSLHQSTSYATIKISKESTKKKQEQQEHQQQENQQTRIDHTTSATMDPQDGDTNNKRTRDFASPQRPLIRKKTKKKYSGNLSDFIPISSGTSEDDKKDTSDFSDFFVIDHEPSEIKFPLSYPYQSTSKDCSNQETKKDICKNICTPSTSKSKAGPKKDSFADIVKADPKKFSFAISAKENLLVRSKKVSKTKATLDDSDIDIIFENEGKPKSKRKSENDISVVGVVKNVELLTPKSQDLAGQARKCHTSTKHGLKTDLRENRPSKDRKGKKKSSSVYKSREQSPAIYSIDIVDPDVVEIEDVTPSSSRSVDVSVIDVSCPDDDDVSCPDDDAGVSCPDDAAAVSCPDKDAGSSRPDKDAGSSRPDNDAGSSRPDKDAGSRPSSSSSDLENKHPDFSYPDDDAGSSSDSDYENKHIDISSSQYISLDKLRVAELQNNEIEIDDATLDFRKELENVRQWELTSLGQEIIGNREFRPFDTMFTVMSYNVLAQTLLTDNLSLYRNCKKEHLDWRYRWALLQHEVDDIDPDILMLQEVQASHYHTYYLPWLTFKGYEGFFKKRSGTKCDGCGIFYKTNQFSLVEHCSVEYNQPKAMRVLDRDNVGLIVKLQPVKQPNSKPLVLATTHLLYNPRRHDVKLAQSVLLLAEIDRLSYEGEQGGRTKYCPVIISGDFNAEPHSTLYDFLKGGRLQYEGLSVKSLTRYGFLGDTLGPELIPPSLGITDRCQHAVLAQGRFLEKSRGSIFSLADKRKLEESLIHLDHSDRNKENKDRNSKANAARASMGTCPAWSGFVSHGLHLNTVYSHRLRRLRGAPEVTTNHQNGWTTVDYILYSRIYSDSHNRPIEGSLKLLGRYGLLSGSEATRFSPLPSSVCPSDHFPLVAKFLLRR